ncbi:MAG: M23 family metallopeptidase [Bacteroidales bacterium]|nr:M23 family metallopeptidase [Bacteroidales bacterium]
MSKTDRKIKDHLKGEFKRFSRRGLALRSVAVILASFALAFAYLFASSVYDLGPLPKTALLRKTNMGLRSRIEMLNYRLNRYEAVLSVIENRDASVYRSMFGLDAVNEDFSALAQKKGETAGICGETMLRMDSLSRRMVWRSRSLDEVSAYAKRMGDLATSVPAIPPVYPDPDAFKLSSRFGYRRDPVFGDVRMHRGQDISARKGTAIYATGDGVVQDAGYNFGGYGNVVKINHGYGYLTLYGHLSKVLVHKGQKVSKGDRIGLMGSTGKSTGSHLHYEVHYKDVPQNPMNYMDISMNTEEYRKILDAAR